MRVLLIEDEVLLANQCSKSLKEKGFLVSIANNGEEALDLLSYETFSIVILDLNLPDYDGLEILKTLRKESDVPVIIVSARDSSDTIITGLEIGADDYIVKPYKLEVLIARIYAVSRRFHGKTTEELVIGELKLIRNQKEIYYQEDKLQLTNKEYSILEYLSLNYPEYVSSEEMMSYVYDVEFNPFSSVVRVHFANLRKKLHHCSQGVVTIEGIKGKGYRLCINTDG